MRPKALLTQLIKGAARDQLPNLLNISKQKEIGKKGELCSNLSAEGVHTIKIFFAYSYSLVLSGME
jgi:hypothetical protein